jgi:hypothetical protein
VGAGEGACVDAGVVRVGEGEQGRIRLRPQRAAQVDGGRQALEGVTNDAVRVGGDDLAGHGHGELAGRLLCRETVHHVAEGVLVGPKAHVGVGVQPPGDHLLAVARAGRDAQHLDDGAGGALVFIAGAVADADAHGSDQVLVVHGVAEPVIAGDEVLDELVQAGLEDVAHPALAEHVHRRRGEALALAWRP